MGRIVEVTRSYLEMSTPAAFRPAFIDTTARVLRIDDPAPALFRRLYAEVGRDYYWLDRLEWTDEDIREYLSDPCLTYWVFYLEDEPAGYFELMRHEDDASVELAYFGLLPAYHGRGLGKHLLSLAVEEAWKLGAARVWLHTTTLDGAAAMPNYLARGFHLTGQEMEYLSLDD